MSPRHARTRCALSSIKAGGAFLSAAAVSSTAIILIAAGPAQASQTASASAQSSLKNAPVAVLTVARQATAHSQQTQAHPEQAPTRSQQASPAPQVPAPGKGIAAALHIKPKLDNTGKWAPSAADTLKLAISQVGVVEDASGGGTKFQKWFVSSPYAERGANRDGGSPSDYANASWCDMFVSWVGDQLGVKGMGADAFTLAHAQWFKDQGRWGNTPTPGAVVFFSWNGGDSVNNIDHVGLVIKDNHDGTIQTVEGNTDSAVKIRTRDSSSVVGYGYPQYGPPTA